MTAFQSNQGISRKRPTPNSTSGPSRTKRWGVILAGGDGTRLRSLTRAISGDDRPKQFCPLVGGRTLLDQTRERVAGSIAADRTLFVMTEKHARFYQPLTAALPRQLLLAQPDNKGTAPAILYALLHIAARSPKAIVALFPSDHYFSDEEAFMSHVESAFDSVQTSSGTVTLLGLTPESPEVEYGWIEPQPSILGSAPGSITRVRRFWEKPSANVARTLMETGCLWNSFVMVGRVDALLQMTRRAVPELFNNFAALVPTFGTVAEQTALRKLYSRITETNFSHSVLARQPNDLAVMRVGEVGWSDLGDPTRVFSTLARLGVRTELAMSAS